MGEEKTAINESRSLTGRFHANLSVERWKNRLAERASEKVDLRLEGINIRLKQKQIVSEIVDPSYEPSQEPSISSLVNDSSIQISLYEYYPFLFHDAFPNVSLEDVRTISLIASLYLRHILESDKLIDRENSFDPRSLFLADRLSEKALDLLHSIFPLSSSFWKHYEEYYHELQEAAILEQLKHRRIISPYTEEEMRKIASGKAAMCKYVTAALAILDGTEWKIDALSRSQDAFNVAFQLNDDMKDWKEDYQNQNYTYLITKIIKEHGFEKEISNGGKINPEAIGRAIYFSGAVESTIEIAERALKEGAEAAEGIHCPRWIKEIQKLENILRQLRSDIAGLKKHAIAIKSAPQTSISDETPSDVKFDVKTAIERGVAFLQQRLDHTNKSILSRLSRQANRQDSSQSIYLSSQVLHSLRYVQDVPLVENLRSRIVDILLKHREEPGVWRFFGKDVDLFPPDLNDTFCVLAALTEWDVEVGSNIVGLLNEHKLPSGLYPLWLDEAMNNRTGVDTIDPLVNANILFYLGLQGLERTEIVDYLKKLIANRIYHDSRGHAVSPFSLAYTISRAYSDGGVSDLQELMPKLTKYVLTRHAIENNWKTPLDAALAAISLMNAGYQGDEVDEAIDYILSRQQPGDGGWSPCPFFQDTALTAHNTRELTTAFCIEALAKYQAKVVAPSTVQGATQCQNDDSPSGSPRCESPYEINPIHYDFLRFLNISKCSTRSDEAELLRETYLKPNWELFEDVLAQHCIDIESLENNLIETNSYHPRPLTDAMDLVSLGKGAMERCLKLLPSRTQTDIHFVFSELLPKAFWMVSKQRPAIVINMASHKEALLDPASTDPVNGDMSFEISSSIARQYFNVVRHELGFRREKFLDDICSEAMAILFVREANPEISLAELFSLSPNELEWCEKNEWYLWDQISSLLYTSDPESAKPFLSPAARPDGWMPSGIGYFMGYKIVSNFMRLKGISSIRDIALLETEKIFDGSEYYKYL